MKFKKEDKPLFPRNKRVLALVVGVVLAVVASGCGAKSSESGGPIRIGLSTYLSGNFAAAGIPMKEGAEAWTAMVNEAGGIDGRKVEVVIKDDAGDQAKAMQNLRQFAADGIKLVVPNGTSSICTAMAPVAKQLGVVLAGGCKDPSLLPPTGPGSYYMTDLSQDTFALAAGVLAKDKFADIESWDIYTMDYLTGQTTAKRTAEEIEKQQPNAKIGKTVLVPLAATDQRSYLSALKSQASNGKRGLYVYLFGSLAPNFVKQAAATGTFEEYDVVIFQSLTDQILDAAGADLPTIWGISDFIPESYDDVKEHAALRAAYEKKFPNKNYPWGHFAATNGLSAFAAAIEAAGSENPEKVRKEFDAGLEFRNHKGDVAMNKHYLASSMALAQCAGDKSSPRGWACAVTETLPSQDITPAQFRSGS